MTAICALVHEGKVYMGGDSAAVGGLSLAQRADTKVFVNGPFLMGFTTSFRMGQLLRWSFSPPVHPEGISDERFMCTIFVDAVRECLKKGGFAKKENEVEQGGDFLVGYHAQLWTVYGDYQVGQDMAGFSAVGCGTDLCLGSLHSSLTYEPAERVLLALAAAERFSAGVRGPFNITVL